MEPNNKKIEDFILSFCENEPEILKQLTRETHVTQLHPRMISGWYQACLIGMIIKSFGVKNILEIGTFTGYSAISMGLNLKNGKITSIEKNDELEDFIRKYIKLANLESVINLKIGDAVELIPNLKENFDLIYIDGDKREYCKYYELLKNQLDKNAIIIVDNILWDNKIFSEPASNDYMTKGIIDFNNMIRDDNDVEKTIIPIRDGLMFIRKK